MFGIIACILFVLRFFGIDMDGHDLFFLGMASLSLQLGYPIVVPAVRTRRTE